MSELFVPEVLRDFVEFNESGYLSERFRRVVTDFNIQNHPVDLERFQCREDGRELDENHIEQLVDTIEKNVKAEEIGLGVFGTDNQLPLIAEIDGKFYSVSGAHRLAALVRAGFTEEVPARIYQVPEGITPVQLEAVFRLISHHENEHKDMPKKLGPKDRIKSLESMLKNPIYQGLPASQLAKITGVSDKTITSLRERLGVKPEQITTKDGKTRSSGRASEGRSNRLEELEIENLRLRKIIDRLKEESHRFKAEVQAWLEEVVSGEELAPEQSPTVKPSTVNSGTQLQLEGISAPPEPEEVIEVTSSPVLDPAPVPKAKKRGRPAKT